jgi:hypothetical protein
MTQVGRLGGLILAAFFTFGGCDGSGGGASPVSSSTDQAKAKGKVTYKGKPLAKVEVRFNPANVNRKSASTVTAMTGDDGTYTITSLVGDNIVTLSGATVSKNPSLSYFTKLVDLSAGENSVDVDVP